MIDLGKNTQLIRRHYNVTGIVQGVGFRPFVYRLANELELSGWVRNSPAGVEIDLQGVMNTLELFEHSLSNNAPPLAVISSIFANNIPVIEETLFSILPSSEGEANIQIAPDSAICPDCLRELLDPQNRRYRYPFITCTNCGPRYTIITATPYDRIKTTMADFPLCPDCQTEYENPLDRRFHAQPIACHACGPQLQLRTPDNELLLEKDAALLQAITLLKNGKTIAIKGIGGYHLAVDAYNHDAVMRLRKRKKRDEKPFAVMTKNIDSAKELAFINEMEEKLLSSSEAPIVIMKKRIQTNLSPLIAPNNDWLGLMLPYSPLHSLLFDSSLSALVMTSGNISNDPVAFKDNDAMKKLVGIADYFLLHNRPIHIRNDDSVIRVFQGRPLFYRRARGYAPRSVTLPFNVEPLLAVGAELKSAVCLANGNKVFLSQHIGDLQNQSTLESFVGTVTHLSEILDIKPTLIACDLHPDYLSTRFAEDFGLPLIRLQHHHAHLAACMAENEIEGETIGIIFDGTGYGSDGTIWGGEFLIGGYSGFRRVGHLKQLPLPGADAAVREPWRMAMAYLYQSFGEAAFTIEHPVTRFLPKNEMELFAQMLRRGLNSPLTSSVGRLFDAVAALLNIRHKVSYDGQGAIELEALAEGGESDGCYSYAINTTNLLQLDFSPMIGEIIADIKSGKERAAIAYRFHSTVAAATTDVCLQLADNSGLQRIILSGGVFQNRLLSEMIYTALTDAGLKVYTHHLTPPNDGCIALGQAAIAGYKNIKRG